jgi:23S rRNA pseudouridine2605 synthase
LGLPVVKIIRVRIGSLELGSLKPREWRLLSTSEVTKLRGEVSSTPNPATKSQSSPKKKGSPPISSRSSNYVRRSGGTAPSSETRPPSQTNPKVKGNKPRA